MRRKSFKLTHGTVSGSPPLFGNDSYGRLQRLQNQERSRNRNKTAEGEQDCEEGKVRMRIIAKRWDWELQTYCSLGGSHILFRKSQTPLLPSLPVSRPFETRSPSIRASKENRSFKGVKWKHEKHWSELRLPSCRAESEILPSNTVRTRIGGTPQEANTFVLHQQKMVSERSKKPQAPR